MSKIEPADVIAVLNQLCATKSNTHLSDAAKLVILVDFYNCSCEMANVVYEMDRELRSMTEEIMRLRRE